MTVEDTWRRQRQWSTLANAKSAAITRWRFTNLTLVLLGALLGVLAAQSWYPSPAVGATGTVGAILLAVAAVVQARFVGPERVRDRVTARHAAETLRAAVHRHRADVGATDADLVAVRERIAKEAESLASEVREATADDAPLPTPGLAAYVEDRARDQYRYHDRRSRYHRDRERTWRAVEVGSTLLAAALSAIGAGAGWADLSAWVGVVTTAAGAVAAHLAGEQHARIAASYAITADNLQQLLAGFDPAVAEPAAAAAFVDAVEDVLGQQNQTWVTTLVPNP